MNTYAIVKGNKVLSLIMWDGVSKISVDGELVIANADTYIGGSYEDNNFIPLVSPEEKERMDLEAQAQAEAKAQLRTSVINKIATNLTSEEKLWLEENL